MSAAYVVSIDGTAQGRSLRNGVDTAVVFATSTADAKAIAEASFGYTQPSVWANATATAAAAAADLAGWRFHVQVIKVSDGSIAADQTYVGVTSDTFDLVGAGLVALLNVDAGGLITHAAYNSSTQVLTVAGTLDGLGDHELVYVFSPPGAAQAVHVPGFVTAHSDQGSAGAALTLTLAADGYTIPKVVAKLARS